MLPDMPVLPVSVAIVSQDDETFVSFHFVSENYFSHRRDVDLLTQWVREMLSAMGAQDVQEFLGGSDE